MNNNKINKLYSCLYKMYWPQWWWPINWYVWANKTKKGNDKWYHILDYTFPRTQDEIFEISLWAILTQNTSFRQVVSSLNNLNNINCLNYKAIKTMPIEDLKIAIKPSWYFNQKSNYILWFIDFFEKLNNNIPSREELLSVRWIWEETADSILLYAYNKPEFVVDAYTKRLFLHLWLIKPNSKYIDIKKLVEDFIKEFETNEKKQVIIFQEFHALIVNHAKQFYSKKPYWVNCTISNLYNIKH